MNCITGYPTEYYTGIVEGLRKIDELRMMRAKREKYLRHNAHKLQRLK